MLARESVAFSESLCFAVLRGVQWEPCVSEPSSFRSMIPWGWFQRERSMRSKDTSLSSICFIPPFAWLYFHAVSCRTFRSILS